MAIRSPFEGFPATWQYERDGKMVFEIKAHTYSPEAKETIKEEPKKWVWAWIVIQVMGLYQMEDPSDAYLLFIIGSTCAFYPLAKKFITWREKTRTHIVLDEDEFRIKEGRKWVRFDRRHNHAFALPPHENIRDEQRELDYKLRRAAQEGELMKMEPVYEDSFHLVYLDLNQPYYLFDIWGLRTATAIHKRLQACDAYLDQHINMGSGQIIDPDDEWDDGPGDIDDDEDE